MSLKRYINITILLGPSDITQCVAFGNINKKLGPPFFDSLKLLLEKANAVRTTNPKQPRSWNRITQITLLTLFNVIVLCLILWSCFPISARMLCFLMDYPTALKMLTSLNTLRSLRMGKYQLKKQN